ncbi:Asp-tRNA(Asn)/Glu-tRNA(Gln) amidotransferase subunit GatB [Candidatus Gracilibacteria bacterium]|nr:Asp-tRNA(Asn)/Glu-tRNA(Gln) amidotransferase subunit GatB [Candidatus Gracilibacteria bacterium]NUJ99445.1 Asp-tRNA(Asn)/Glu-tRNA(Gln) amidotransferase subunit GatB [Candidatus Gracilibacteria bacterium]
MEKYEKVIGLEIHVRVKSQTKMFCSCKNAVELASDPNMNVCPVCMGFPGMLPALNEEVVRLGVKAGMLMNCKINKTSRFDRKSYFYPDLPNSFQTTQMYETITGAGSVKVMVNGEVKEFLIHHMHLENDAGKLIHVGGRTLCDYNRAGSPLMEIVTEPVFYDKEEVMEFLKELQKMFRAYEISDADMEKGQLRCDVNISIRPTGEQKLGTRVELKNLNSFSSVGRAIESEYARQVRIKESGGTIDQETRGWDDTKGMSATQRTKEDAMDYRYFPEPDLLPIEISDELIEECRNSLGELPIEKRVRYLNDYSLSQDDARILTADVELAKYFEALFALTGDAKKSCSYITTILLALINESDEKIQISELKFDIRELASVIDMVNKDELSSINSKEVVAELFKNGGNAGEITDKLGLRQKNDVDALMKIVEQVITSFPSQVEEYKGGNEKIFGFFVGQCMKLSAGQGNPKIFNDLIKKRI